MTDPTQTGRFPVSGPAGQLLFRKSSCLVASHSPVELTAAVATAELDDQDTRLVSGLVLPLGPVGYTSVGPIRALEASAVQIPTDLARVKLMDYHQAPAVAIGYCTAARWTDQGLRASFRVAATPAGDAALLEIRERVRDGLSVELGAIDIDGDVLRASQWLGVALVPIPAWADARHDGLAAARDDSTTTTTTEGITTMTEEQRARFVELVAMNARTPEEEGELAELMRAIATTPDPAAADASGTQAPEAAASHTADPEPARVPAGMPGGARTQGRHQLADLYAAQARVISGVSRPELEAALADITLTNNVWAGGTVYDGQLWSGLEYVRRFIPLMTPGPLTSYKGTGWRWNVKPVVADYAGDKTAVPSNSPTTVDTSWTAARLAGAHDIDRAIVDFGNREYLEAYYAAMTESYAIQSDDKARAKLLAIAAANTAVTGATDLFGAAARASDAVQTATNGVVPDYFLINGTDRLGLLGVTSADVPAYLEAFGVTPDKFVSTPGVAAGTVIAGIRQAARWRELGSVPIRVETINITNGGVDGGVFGYYATETVHAGGVQRATFA